MGVTTTAALILRHQDERERDRLIIALTPDHGLLRLRARGTKRSTAKLAGSLEPLTGVTLSFADGRAMGLITGAVIDRRFPELRTDLVSTVSAQWLAELVERLTKPGHVASDVWDILPLAWQEIIDQATATLGRRWLVLNRLAWQLMSAEGFVPSLEHCPRCQQPMPTDPVWYVPLLGFVHDHERVVGAKRVSRATVEFLQTGQPAGQERQVFTELQPLIESLIEHTLDRPLQSTRVLKSVFRAARLSPVPE